MDGIAEPLAELQPDMPPEDRAIRARTLFGAVHGVVSISLDSRFVGLPPARLAREMGWRRHCCGAEMGGFTSAREILIFSHSPSKAWKSSFRHRRPGVLCHS